MATEKNLPQMEERVVQSELTIREDPETKEKFIDGVIKINNYSRDLGGFKEVIKPGAFDPIMKDDIRGLINHNPDLIIGRTKAHTMTIALDGEGHLRYSIKLPNTTIASDYAESIKRGDIDGTSFAFRVGKQNWKDEGEKNPIIREILEFNEFRDISPVTYPAYPNNSVGVSLRALYEADKTPEPGPVGTPILSNCKAKLRLIEIER